MAEPNPLMPEFQRDAFYCPNCRAYAHFEWFNLLGKPANGMVNNTTLLPHGAGQCGRCRIFTLWSHETEMQSVKTGITGPIKRQTAVYRLVFPKQLSAPHAHPDLPDDCRDDYEEARKVLEDSPRAAAALLRLVTEKLCRWVCEASAPGSTKGKKLNDLIGEMVSRGMLPTLQQVLDTLRVIGNESVHPGTMDIGDDKETALRLFGLVAIVVEQTVTQPKKIAELYGTLPAGALAGITKRDGS